MNASEKNKLEDESKNKKSEEIAQEAMGDIGRWQVGIVILMAGAKLPIAWTLLGLVLMGAPVDYQCAQGNETCLTDTGDECQEWIYDRSVFKETITTEWDLVCSKSQLVNVAQMTFMIGIMVGNIIFSIASDRYGRRNPLIISAIIQVITGVSVAFVPWYLGFIFLRFLLAIAVGGTMTITYVLCMEVLNGKWRTVMATLSHIPFNLGTMIMAGIAYYTRHWRYYQLATSLPVLLMISYWWLVPESPRWLLAVGRNKEALAVLQTAAKTNKNPLPEKLPEINLREDETEKKYRASILDLLRTPNMCKKTLVLWFNWMVVGFCFFGLEQYLSHSGGNIFLNLIISSACIIPGVLSTIYTLDKFGRKRTLFCGQMLSALSCFCILIIPQTISHADWYRVGCAIVGVSGTAVAFTCLYLYSAELFPTVVRNTGLGSGSMIARIGSMIAPFAASLDKVSFILPPTLFGGASLCAAGLCIVLPETLNTEIPITLEDGENFTRKNRKKIPKSTFKKSKTVCSPETKVIQ